MNTITATSRVLFLSNAALSLNIDQIGVSEASKCRGINYLPYCVTFLYLRILNLNKKGYQTMSCNFLVVLYFQYNYL